MSLDDFSLQDRVAVVTGGGGGIGLEIGRALRAAGATVVAAELNAETGRVAAQELEGDFVQTDVTEPRSVGEMVRTVLDGHGKLDVFVNNAGIAHNVAAEEMTDEEWRGMLSINPSRRPTTTSPRPG
jgi:NAD(P)-dependent dehydrogenase (short-subunit alcohol dehydrogenase family)